MAKPPILVIANDIHAGSTQALMPDQFVTHEGQRISQNPIQKFLWRCFEDAKQFVADVAGDDEYDLLFNGDCIEGLHHKATQIISPELGDHIRCFKEVVAPLAEGARKKFVVLGTPCHVSLTEVGLGEWMDAEKDPATGFHAFDRLSFNAHGVQVTAKHHMSTSTRAWAEATGLASELANEQLEATRNGEAMPRILLMAHRHRYGQYCTGSEMAICGAPWQMLTKFGYKVVGSARTKPGIFILDWRGRGHGELPRVHHRLYKAPMPAAISL